MENYKFGILNRNHLFDFYLNECDIFKSNLKCHRLGLMKYLCKRMHTNEIVFVSNNLRLLLGRKPHSWHQ